MTEEQLLTHEAAIDEFVRRASAAVAPERVYQTTYDPLMRSVGLGDIHAPRKGAPQVTVVRAPSAEAVSAILRIASELKLKVSVRQATGYLTPDIPRPESESAVAIDLRDMKDVNLCVDEGYVEVGPHVTLASLNKCLAPHGYTFPISVEAVTWGSLVGLNTSGQLVDARYGKPGSWVLGLQVVLPDGEIIETGSRTLRTPTGPDLTRFFVGGQALFGVITQVRLRLVKRPRETTWATASFDSLASLADAVAATYREGAVLPTVFDFMDSRYMEFTGSFDQPIPPALMMVQMDGEAPGSARWALEELFGIFRDAGATATREFTAKEWDDLATIRYRMWDDFKDRNLVQIIGEVIDSPLTRLSAVLEGTRMLQDAFVEKYPGLEAFFWGHIGSQSFHPAFAAPLDWPYEKHRQVATEFRAELLEFKLAHGASVGEQGVFPGHRDWFIRTYGERSYEILGGIKRVFDPDDLFDSGRL